MLKIFKKLFDNEYKELKKFEDIANKIEELDEKMSKLSDKKLASYTDKFKKRLEEGENFRRYSSRSFRSRKGSCI